MFEIDFHNISLYHGQLGTQRKQLAALSEQLNGLKEQIKANSGMEEVLQQLGIVHKKMENQQAQLEQMERALEMVQQLWERYENSIIDHCENSRHFFTQLPLTVEDTSYLDTYMADIEFK